MPSLTQTQHTGHSFPQFSFLFHRFLEFSENVSVPELFVKDILKKREREFQEARICKGTCGSEGLSYFLGEINFINFMRRFTAHTLPIHP